MNQIAAMCKSLLKGEVLSIMNAFKWFGVTNFPREAGRSIERKFNVRLARVQKNIKTRYGQNGYFYEYRLNRVPDNLPGIAKMEAYVSEIEQAAFKPPVKRGAKTIHVKTYDPVPPPTPLIQTSLFGN